MAQGDVSNTVQSGGQLPPNSSLQSRVIIALGVCTAGVVNTLYQFANSLGITASLDTGALADYCAKILQHGAGAVYGIPVNPSAIGAVSASVTHAGTGLATCAVTVAPHKAISILITTGGTLGNMKCQFSLDGGVTWGPVTPSVSGWSSTGYLVPGTYCTLSFSAATYVLADTGSVGVDGTIVSPASAGVIAIVSVSPVDNYNVLATVVNGGKSGTATLSLSLDGGLSQLPNTMIPVGTGGPPTVSTIVIPGTGLVLAFTGSNPTVAGDFVAGDTYALKATGPSFSTSDVTAAINAVRSLSTTPTVALCHVIALPGSAAGAISMASTLDGALTTLATAQFGKNWLGMVECPSKSAGDTIVSGGAAIVDTADTDTVIRAARVGSTFNRTSVFVATQEQKNALNSWCLRRPTGWGLAARYVEADPVSDPSWVKSGGLDFVLVNGALRRDEFSAGVTLYDAQFNVLKTYANRTGAYLTIESGGVGWRNMTTTSGWQDANFIRVLNIMLAAITAAGQNYLGAREGTNPDGTITALDASIISSDLDNVAKLSVGVSPGGAFTTRQASDASASVLTTSQLGNAPKRLDVQYGLRDLGLISAVNDSIAIS